MSSIKRRLLESTTILAIIPFLGCDSGTANAPKGDEAKVVIPADVPKSFQEYQDRQNKGLAAMKGVKSAQGVAKAIVKPEDLKKQQ